MTAARFRTGVRHQAGNAAFADATPLSTSASFDIATDAHCCPVAESDTSNERPDDVSTNWPPTQFVTFLIGLIAAAFSAIVFVLI